MGAEDIVTKDYTKENHVDKVDMCQALKEMMEDATSLSLNKVQALAVRMAKSN